MPNKVIKSSILNEIKKDLTAFHAASQSRFTKAKNAAQKSGDKDLLKFWLQKEKEFEKNFNALFKKAERLTIEFESEFSKRTTTLKTKIKKLERLQAEAQTSQQLLENKRKELLSQSEELINTNEEIKDKNEELLAQKQQIVIEVEMLRKSREEILEKKNELEEKTDALLDQADYLDEANKVITNMHTELASQKDEIENKNAELLNLNLEKNNLIGIVAHDLKSPLHQIKGLTSLIKMTEKGLGKEAADCLDLIESSAKRMNEMISKILDIEAIESKQLNLTIQKLNVSEIVQNIGKRFEIEAQKKQIKLHYQNEEPFFIHADLSYLDQIFENLLSNAIKFSPQKKNIYLTLTEQESKVRVLVKDEGPGMTDDDKKKLFNKYQKLSARPTANESSTGLGLSIVKKFVEDMKGKIWCESETGKGASFFVQFDKA